MKWLLLLLLLCLPCSAQGWLPLVKSAGGGGSLLLDTLSAPATVAFSTRKLRTAYAGSAIQVKRTSDATTQNIGFDGSNNLDATALSAFCAATTCEGFFYDQTVNSHDSSTLSGAGPTFATGGTNQTINGHVCPVFSSGTLQFTVSLSQPTTIALMAKLAGTGNNALFTDGVSASPRQVIGQVSGDFGTYAGTSLMLDGAFNTSAHDFVATFTGSTSDTLVIDGSTTTGTNTGSNGVGNQTIGAGFGGGSIININGQECEYLLFGSVLGSTDQTIIRTSWQSYWGTP